MIIPAKRVCDFCGKEDPRFVDYAIPVKTRCNWTDGEPEPEHIEFVRVDACEECLLLVTNALAEFQGSSLRIGGEREK